MILSPTLAINEKVKEFRNQGKNVISFGLGQSPFPVPESIVCSLRENAHQKDYLQVQGLKELRESVSSFNKRVDKLDFRPDNIMIGPGSKELIFTLLSCFEGIVIIPIPYWVTYVPQAHYANKKIRFIRTKFENKFQVQSEDLRDISDKDSKKILILNYPSNPCGNEYSIDNLEAIAQVARETNTIILSDEIYGQLNFKGAHMSIAHYYPEGTIVSSGLSKWCGAGGWRLGTFSFPIELNELKQKMISMASETFSSVSAPIQYAAITAFNGNDEIDNYLTHSRKILAAISFWIYTTFSEANVKVENAVGGFYLFPNFEYYKKILLVRGIMDSDELSNRLLHEANIATLPGTCFGLDKNELVLRLSFVDFEGAKALNASYNSEEAINIDFLEKHCSRMLTGTKMIINWLQQV